MFEVNIDYKKVLLTVRINGEIKYPRREGSIGLQNVVCVFLAITCYTMVLYKLSFPASFVIGAIIYFFVWYLMFLLTSAIIILFWWFIYVYEKN